MDNTLSDNLIAVNAYMAAFIDGEGHIKMKRNAKRGDISCCIRITNKNKDVLLFINKYFGGVIYTYKNTNGCKMFRMEWNKQEQIKDILTRILSYLIIKKPHAELMLEYLKRQFRSKVTELDIEICNKMKILNKRHTSN